MMEIRRATQDDVTYIVKFIDSTFTKEGYGFVTSAQIKTETKRGAVWVAVIDDEIIGVRVGIDRVYNLTVHPKHRRQGIGAKLILAHPPVTIRVKSVPVGHLSQKQKDEFTNPEHFYEALGYKFIKQSYPKNFWAGQAKGEKKRVFVKRGEIPHIKIYQHESVIQNAELEL
jgi:N-acetylglutamate synthase-like GNAT family acetyltransferase